MAVQRPSKAGWIASLIALIHFVITVIVYLILVSVVDEKRYGAGLWLTVRILWGCWIVHVLALLLTRVTIFGWYFRRYFRWPGNPPEGPVVAAELLPRQGPLRPARAPWGKSSKASFSTTVILVSLTGASALAWVVLWILKGDVLSDWVYGLVLGIVLSSWWVLCIITVLTRVAIFGSQRKKAVEQAATSAPETAGAPETSPQKTESVGTNQQSITPGGKGGI